MCHKFTQPSGLYAPVSHTEQLVLEDTCVKKVVLEVDIIVSIKAKEARVSFEFLEDAPMTTLRFW